MSEREFIVRVTQDWEFRITAESPEHAEATFEELGGRSGKSECTGYSVDAVVSAEKKDDYDAEDERAKCTCGHLFYSDHSITGCHRHGCGCLGAVEAVAA